LEESAKEPVGSGANSVGSDGPLSLQGQFEAQAFCLLQMRGFASVDTARKKALDAPSDILFNSTNTLQNMA
jgi:hypothetical protein